MAFVSCGIWMHLSLGFVWIHSGQRIWFTLWIWPHSKVFPRDEATKNWFPGWVQRNKADFIRDELRNRLEILRMGQWLRAWLAKVKLPGIPLWSGMLETRVKVAPFSSLSFVFFQRLGLSSLSPLLWSMAFYSYVIAFHNSCRAKSHGLHRGIIHFLGHFSKAAGYTDSLPPSLSTSKRKENKITHIYFLTSGQSERPGGTILNRMTAAKTGSKINQAVISLLHAELKRRLLQCSGLAELL